MLYARDMERRTVRILKIMNQRGCAYYRITIPKEIMAENGNPETALMTVLAPEDKGGPAWILEPTKKRR
jgi:hypothetical protein